MACQQKHQAWTSTENGQLEIFHPTDAQKETNINIMNDYLIPWYIINPNFHHFSEKEMTHLGTLKLSGAQIKFHLEALKEYYNNEGEHEKQTDSLQKTQNISAIVDTMHQYNPSIGREVLSWIYCRRCCFFNSNDVNQVYKLADEVGIQDLKDAIVCNSLNDINLPLQSSVHSMPILCTFMSATVDYRNPHKIRLGLHLHYQDFFHFEHDRNNCYKVRSPGPAEKLAHSFHACLLYIHTISKNSHDLHENIDIKREIILKGRRNSCFLFKPNQFRLQILTKDYGGIEEAIVKSDENVVLSFAFDRPSFFYDIHSKQPYFTISSSTYQSLIKFMRAYVKCGAASRFALEIRKPSFFTVQRLMGAVKEMGFNALENVLYVLHLESQTMLDVMEKLEESANPCKALVDLKVIEVVYPKPLSNKQF